jgi:hypothetical protein
MNLAETNTEDLIQDYSDKKLKKEYETYANCHTGSRLDDLFSACKVMLSKDNFSWFASREFYVLSLLNELYYRKLL